MDKDKDREKSSFRRAKSRASRACEVCHARKVRCDVTVHMPCTNCAAFGCECKIPQVRTRRPARSGDRVSKPEHSASASNVAVSASSSSNGRPQMPLPASNGSRMRASTSESASGSASGPSGSGPPGQQFGSESNDQWGRFLEHDFSGRAKADRPGAVGFLGPSTSMNLLLQELGGEDGIHYSIPGTHSQSRLNDMDKEEINILKMRGAFLLPSRELCDDIVETYFERVHPVVPLISRTRFMRQYADPANPPSLLLLQAVLLAGATVCKNPSLLDNHGTNRLALDTFYKRAKALFDAEYETDRICIIQACTIMGWSSENPEEVTRNLFFWTRIALSVAQAVGMHRNVETSSLSVADKRIWKRIWWTLFCRDRYLATALGRPVLIDLEDSDVPVLTEEDFIEDEPDLPSPYVFPRLQVLSFVHTVKLSEIMGMVIKSQYSVGAMRKNRQHMVPDVSHCDMALAQWMQNLPPELSYSVKDRSSHELFKALLHSQYYTVLCLIHRSHILSRRKDSAGTSSRLNSDYPSWGIAFQAAHMITKIMENLRFFNELHVSPHFVIYTAFSAIIILLYQTDSSSADAVESANQALVSLMDSMEQIGRTYYMGRILLKIFQHMEDNPTLKHRIISSARRFHPRRTAGSSANGVNGVNGARSVHGVHGVNGGINANANAQTLPMDFSMDSSEFYLVTNKTDTAYYENFQPSHLFPEVQEGLSLSNAGMTSSSQGPTPQNPDSVSMISGSPGSQQGYMGFVPSPSDTVDNPPNSMNLGDWYNFIKGNTDTLELDDFN